MSALLKSVIKILVLMTLAGLLLNCSVFSSYQKHPLRTIRPTQKEMFSSRATVFVNGSRRFELAGYSDQITGELFVQGYLPPPTFKNLFMVHLTNNSLQWTDPIANRVITVTVSPEEEDLMGIPIGFIRTALYLPPFEDADYRVGWKKEDPNRARLYHLPYLSEFFYSYSFEEEKLLSTEISYEKTPLCKMKFNAFVLAEKPFSFTPPASFKRYDFQLNRKNKREVITKLQGFLQDYLVLM